MNALHRLATALGLAFFISLSGQAQADSADRCTRIVSFAPSVTEVLFDLGLGDRVVGVTRFCRYPADAQKLPHVGGLYDISLEQVLSLKPTDVFMLKENSASVRSLDALGIRSSVLDHSRVSGIKASYEHIGRVCGVETLVQQRLAELDRHEQQMSQRCQGGTSKAKTRKTMVVVGRVREGSATSGIYISGRDGFYSDVLRIVGCENVNTQPTVAVPTLSAEGILKLAPEVIVEIVNQDDQRAPESFEAFWGTFSKVPAVQSHSVFMIKDDFASIPGPRYIQLASLLSSILCPG
jgi:iron complex transport system substrate-binding protein